VNVPKPSVVHERVIQLAHQLLMDIWKTFAHDDNQVFLIGRSKIAQGKGYILKLLGLKKLIMVQLFA
jgi:hypothetical protein